MYPEMDRDLKMSSCLVSFSRGLLWSWGPQLASHREVILSDGRGNFTNDSTLEAVTVWKLIPRVCVPFRYLMTRLTCWR